MEEELGLKKPGNYGHLFTRELTALEPELPLITEC